MATIPLQFKRRDIYVHEAIISPDFNKKAVLVENKWEYVAMWLKRKKANSKVLFLWEQARDFYFATRELDITASPLTAYYSFLNATKTLLEYKKFSYSDNHGVTGKHTGIKTILANEVIKFKTGGVLFGLSQYLNETVSATDIFNLKQVLYNIPYIHRAYNLTFERDPELFIPISNPLFMKKVNSTECWFSSEISDRKYKNQLVINKLPQRFERDCINYREDKDWMLRSQQRFQWRSGRSNLIGNLVRLTNYHKIIRQNIFYIFGPSKLWYIKRGNCPNLINKSTLTLTFAAMHRLSEISRYDPFLLSKHFESSHNWLLSEFINSSIDQFIDNIASEITGKSFLIPGRRASH